MAAPIATKGLKNKLMLLNNVMNYFITINNYLAVDEDFFIYILSKQVSKRPIVHQHQYFFC